MIAGSLPTVDQIRTLALAIAKDRSARRLDLDPDGHKVQVGWTSIEAATSSGRAFMVTPSVDMLAVDADSESQIAALDTLEAELRAAGHRPVLLNSGRGHHLFARLGPGWVRWWARRGRDLGLDVRLRQPIRPPLSPHPAGLPVYLVGTSVDDAIEALAPLSRSPNRLSRSMYGLLREGTGLDRYRSGSEAVQAVATACVNAGLTSGWYLTALTDPANALSEVANRRPDPRGWLQRSWDKAVVFVREHPLPESAGDLLRIIDDLDRQIDAGEVKASDLAVLLAHIDQALLTGNAIHLLPVDRCAIAAGVSKATVRNARKRLVKRGLLVRVEDGGGAEAGVWQLREVAPAQSCTPTTHTPPEGDESRGTSLRALDMGADVHRFGALGKLGPFILQLLEQADGEPQTTAVIASKIPTGPHPGTVRRILAKLKESNLVARSPDGWFLLDASAEALDRVAEEYGKLGKREAETQRFQAEREARGRARIAHARWRDGQHPRCDYSTGEILAPDSPAEPAHPARLSASVLLGAVQPEPHQPAIADPRPPVVLVELADDRRQPGAERPTDVPKLNQIQPAVAGLVLGDEALRCTEPVSEFDLRDTGLSA